uniref:Lipocalin n=1 Tax=Rhipicephalus zambeziensis TaxID=60191 RepID=A0A224Y803_9ACAR
MAGLFKILVVGLVVIAAVTWCEGDEAVGHHETAVSTPTKAAEAKSNNSFYLFLEGNLKFWDTEGKTTLGNCSWYRAYSLTDSEVKFEVGTTWNAQEGRCGSGYISSRFGANGIMFDISVVVGYGHFHRIRYSNKTCAVVEGAHWGQRDEKHKKSCENGRNAGRDPPKCETGDGPLDPFFSKSCCHTNTTDQMNVPGIRLFDTDERYYCSCGTTYTIYVGDSVQPNMSPPTVPQECVKAYEALKGRK